MIKWLHSAESMGEPALSSYNSDTTSDIGGRGSYLHIGGIVVYLLSSQPDTELDLIYKGYSTNFNRRIRQHRGEIVGGAKRTSHWRRVTPVCFITGFSTKSEALSYEWYTKRPCFPNRPCKFCRQAAAQVTVEDLLLYESIRSAVRSREFSHKVHYHLQHFLMVRYFEKFSHLDLRVVLDCEPKKYFNSKSII